MCKNAQLHLRVIRRNEPPALLRDKSAPNLSPKVRALRRQQGQYMGLVRRLKAGQKARVRAVREKKGLPAAIRLALTLGR